MAKRKSDVIITPRTFWEPLLYASPFLLICLSFAVWPIINVFLNSFREGYNFIKGTYKSIGLENYEKLFNDRYFISSLKNTMIYVFVTVPISTVLALLFSVLLNRKIHLHAFFQTSYFLPMVTSSIAIGLVWKYMFNSDYGIINSFLQMFGVEGPKWLRMPNDAMKALCVFGIWKSLPTSIIMLLSGLQSIDPRYYIAARMDGASSTKQFFRITLPLLSPTIALVLTTRVISASKVFNEVFVLWNSDPGPARSLYTVVFYIYEAFFENWKIGIASAAAVVLFFIVFALTVVQLFVQKKLVFYK